MPSPADMLLCAGEQRSAVLRNPAHPRVGIEFVEYRRDLGPPTLEVTLTRKLPAPALGVGDVAIDGGVRIVGIRAVAVAAHPTDPARLRIALDREGDFSFYVLRLADAGHDGLGAGHPALDPERSQARFGFKAECPSEFDCRQPDDCPDEPFVEPALDYLAKDYQSFRRLFVDLIAQRNPHWQERLPADLGMTLVELIAYAGDYLSYQQDAAATEAFLDTCRHRVSAARHARLVDYRMHQGRSAWTFVHFTAEEATAAVLPPETRLSTRIGRALRGAPAPPGTLLPATADWERDPALADAVVFETTAACRVDARHNELRIHGWGDARCCLAAGATEAFLFGLDRNGTAFAPVLEAGEYLLLEEARSPATGIEADADPAHRYVVRLTAAGPALDSAFTDKLKPRNDPARPPLPLLRVRWEPPLRHALCLSSEDEDGRPIDPVTIARGNIAPADHGRARLLDSAKEEIGLPDEGRGRWPQPGLALPSTAAPLAHAPMAVDLPRDGSGRPLADRHGLDAGPRDCLAQCVLLLDTATGRETWGPVPHLLDSTPQDQHFVAEIDDGGRARLRFGDGLQGRRPVGVRRVEARVRLGGGRAGNIGAGALVHVAPPDGVAPPPVERVYQPLAASGGVDAETIAEVRALAPEAHRAVQHRAVTEADWVAMALRHPGVEAARAVFRWTGSWHTVLLAIHPRDPADLVRLPGGGVRLTPAFADGVTAHLTRFKLAGYDLAVGAAVYVPLGVDIRLCVAPGHHRGAVLAAATHALLSPPGRGTDAGFFHHLGFGFGEAVQLSRLYARLDPIPGLDSAEVTRFARYWSEPADELERGRIAMAPSEIARLRNDPNHAEDGVLRLTAVGGL
ncbi:MAG TPA: hypothetical protein VF704_10755 [Allosphingosinicella sp.]